VTPVPSLTDISSQVRAHIFSFLFSENPWQSVKTLASLERISRTFYQEIESKLETRTNILRASIEDGNIERWEHDSPLRAFLQAHLIHDTVNRAQGLENTEAEKVYLGALKEGSFTSASRVLAYKLAKIAKAWDPTKPMPGEAKILAAFHSFWRDLQEAAALRRPFEIQKYKTGLTFYEHLKQRSVLVGYDPVQEERQALENMNLAELLKVPSPKLNIFASFLDNYGRNAKLWLASAMQNDPEGQFNLACWYFKRGPEDVVKKGVYKRDKEATEYSSRILEQDKGSSHAIQNCDRPEAENPDLQRAGAYWMGKAAKQDVLGAQNNYALLQLQGIGGIPQDLKAAFEGFKKAADTGLVLAQYNLAACYADGQGTEQDDAKALEWFKKAAKQKMNRAIFNVGLYYELGKGCVQNYVRAAKRYERAVQNHADTHIPHWGCSSQLSASQNNLAILYELGLGVDQDYTKAFDLYKSAFGENLRGMTRNVEAITIINCARCHELGIGTPKDLEEAEKKYNFACKFTHKTKEELHKTYTTLPVPMKLENWFFMYYPQVKYRR
jgi:TPR repeat protein